MAGPAFAKVSRHRVLASILCHQPVNFGIRHLFRLFHKLADTVSVYRIPELNLRGYLVALDARGALGPLIEALAGHPVADVQVHAPKLEDILAEYYRRAG